MNLPEMLKGLDQEFGFLGERRALALLCLGFFATLFALFALIAGSQLPEWTPFFVGMAACYGVGFFALAAGWFWGRWFATGLGYSGLMTAVMTLFATRDAIPQLVVFGVMHGLVWVCLLGKQMEALYDARDDWKKRFGLDEKGALKVRRSVTRAASSLPTLISLALAPRQSSSLLAVAGLVLGGGALFGLVRGRSFGVLALVGAAAAAGLAVLVPAGAGPQSFSPVIGPMVYAPLASSSLALLAFLCLAAAAAPFAAPVARFLRAPAQRHR